VARLGGASLIDYAVQSRRHIGTNTDGADKTALCPTSREPSCRYIKQSECREIGCGGSLSRRHHYPMLGWLAAGKTETPP
jgi:hypothetical protein